MKKIDRNDTLRGPILSGLYEEAIKHGLSDAEWDNFLRIKLEDSPKKS